MNRRLLWPLIFAGALSSGCATTTHYINLDPSVQIQSAQLQNKNKIEVSTSSSVDKQLGSIDTAIQEHADLVLSNEVEESVKTSVERGLASLGFKLDQGALPSSKVHVDIVTLSYTTKTKALKTVATLRFVLKATVEAKGKTYTANYGSEKIDEYGTLPTQEEVQTSINTLAGETVNRLLNDSNVRILLQ